MRRIAITGAMSSSVSTARTPGTAIAAPWSMLVISACGCGLRTNAACQTPGRLMSSMNRPRPRSSGSSSRRVMRVPMVGADKSGLSFVVDRRYFCGPNIAMSRSARKMLE